jgi:H+-translocating diphosphatase
LFLTIFLALFAVLLALTVEPKLGTFYTTTAFLVGGFTSIVAGYIGMRIAVYTNVRTAKECACSIADGFVVAYRGGQVLGFTLVGLALLVLQILIVVF